ncbi:hypothetical protein [Streptomyces sp. NPDC054952]
MQAQNWGGISVKWTRPHPTDLVVSASLFYLLYLDPAVPKLIAAVVATVALRCIRLSRAV